MWGNEFGNIFALLKQNPAPIQLTMAKILIIDDEAPIRSSLREILEYENFQVSEAEDGAEGVKLASKFAFDVIFCDVKMPKFDGFFVVCLIVFDGVKLNVEN